MDTIQIFKKALSLTWRNRALWLFGFLLALTVCSAPWWPLAGSDRIPMENRINFLVSTVYFPGQGVTIDFRSLQGPIVTIEGPEPGQVHDLVQQVNLPNLKALLIAIGLATLIYAIPAILLRYSSQAALIRMVDEGERSAEQAGIRRGLRLGWSRVAVRLFLIDLCLGMLIFLVFSLLFALSISPFFLLGWLESISASVASVIGVSLLGVLGLSLFFALCVAAAVVLSITRPVIHQACAVDGLGVGASLSQGFRLFRTRFAEVILTWLAWMGVRLVWSLALIPLIILLSPVLLLSMILGAAAGAVPALLATGIASLSVSSVFAWIIGAIFGIPLFLVVTFAPINFLSGLVEVFKSSFWTLSYREFRPLPSPAPQPAAGPGLASLEPSLAH